MIQAVNTKKLYSFGLQWASSWALMNWYYTFGIFSSSARSMVSTVARNLNLHRLGQKKADLAGTDWKTVFPSLRGRLVETGFKDGNVSLFEMLVLASAVAELQPKNVFEIGTFNGRTALNIAANLPSDGRIFTLDLPAEKASEVAGILDHGDLHYINSHKPGELIDRSNIPEKSKITRLLGDSASYDYTPYIGKMDLVFVDGSHHIDYVRRDTETALKLLRDGRGMILWHDYDGYVGVTEFIDAFIKQNPQHKIQRFADTTLAYLWLR